MKLTIAFLVALAAADAAEARTHRQARRQYGTPGDKPSYGDVSSAKPIETPAPSSVEAPYIQSSAEAFETSYPAGAVSSYPAPSTTPEVPSGGETYPSTTPEVPEGGKSSEIPYVPVETPKGGESYPPAASSSAYGSGFSAIYPSSAVPSGVYPSDNAYPIGGASSTPYGSGVYPSSGAGYPTGTGVYGASSTPLSDYVSKTISKAEDCVTSEYPVSEVVKTLTETLVYTVGVGSTAHPVTTEVVTTSTSTVYKTVVITKGKEGDKTVYPEGKPATPTGTTTSTSTTTSTKYVTVKPTPSGKVPSNGQGYPSKQGEECAAPVTVTVTAKETVTVTKGQDKPTKPTETPKKPEEGYPAPSKPGKPEHPKPSATPSGKYPVGNGTYPYPPGPTGFKTSTKPEYPVGTGHYGSDIPSKPSSLPAFSYASDVYETPAPSKTPSKDNEYPAYPEETPKPASSAPPAGGEYGSGYEAPASSSGKVPSNGQAYPTPTPANDYGSGYNTY